MSNSTTSKRLKQIMEERQLKQVDILTLAEPYCEKYNVKLNRSDLSQYVSGKVAPSQNKLVVLGKALDVSEAWLMGIDTEQKRDENYKSGNDYIKLYLNHKKMFENFQKLNESDKELVEKLIYSLSQKEKAEN